MWNHFKGGQDERNISEYPMRVIEFCTYILQSDCITDNMELSWLKKYQKSHSEVLCILRCVTNFTSFRNAKHCRTGVENCVETWLWVKEIEGYHKRRHGSRRISKTNAVHFWFQITDWCRDTGIYRREKRIEGTSDFNWRGVSASRASARISTIAAGSLF